MAFSQRQHWGDPAILRSDIDEAWEIAGGAPVEPAKIADLERRTQAVTPNSDNFPNADVTAAQEAAFMVTLLLQFCRKRRLSYVVRIATFARDTIDLYVQSEQGLDPSDPNLEEKIASHPLMVRELERKKQTCAHSRL